MATTKKAAPKASTTKPAAKNRLTAQAAQSNSSDSSTPASGRVPTELQALQAKIAELQTQAEDLIRTERNGVIAQVKELAHQYKLNVSDVFGGKAIGGRSSSMKGQKVAPKYRNPTTAATWSGRGRKPGWLEAALKAGKKLEDFALAS